MLGGSLRVSWVLLRVAVVAVAVAIAVAWRFYGYVPVAVQTGSMAPTYPPHTLLFVHDTPAQDVRTGDVITFDPPGRVPRTTHRVVERTKHSDRWYFRTRGDANPADDDWRMPGSAEAGDDAPHLRGVSYMSGMVPRTEFAVPHLGWLSTLGAMPRVRLALLAIPFIVIALQLLAWIWRTEDDDEEMDDAAGDPALPAHADAVAAAEAPPEATAA